MDINRDLIVFDTRDISFTFDVSWAADEPVQEIFRPGEQLIVARDRILQRYIELANGEATVLVVPGQGDVRTSVFFAHSRDTKFVTQLARGYGLLDPNAACMTSVDVSTLHQNALLRIVGADLYGKDRFSVTETARILSNVSPRMNQLLASWFKRHMFRACEDPIARGAGWGHKFDVWDLTTIPLVRILGQVGIALKHFTVETGAQRMELRPDDRSLDEVMDELIETFAQKFSELPEGPEKAKFLAELATLRKQENECKRLQAESAIEIAAVETRARNEALHNLLTLVEKSPLTAENKAKAVATFQKVCNRS
jgi:hypothetical protein